MGLKANHALDPRVATSEMTDDAGNLLGMYDGKTDTLVMTKGVTGETVLRAFFCDWIQYHKTSVAAMKTQSGVKNG